MNATDNKPSPARYEAVKLPSGILARRVPAASAAKAQAHTEAQREQNAAFFAELNSPAATAARYAAQHAAKRARFNAA